MCLYVKSGSKMRVAREPITVYKVIRFDNTSVVRGFQYKPNTLYRLRRALKVIKYDEYLEINAGFHSYTYKSYQNGKKLVEFTIPKGAKYYVGMNSQIVSTSIRSGSLEAMKNFLYL